MRLSADTREDAWHAARVAGGLLVPGVLLLLCGRPDLLVYAAFGSFTGMYGRREPLRARFLHQVQGALILVLGTGLGITLAATRAHAAILVAVAIVVGATISLVSDRIHLRPEGPFYALFALGATALIPIRPADQVLAWGICVAAAAWAVLFGAIDVWLRPCAAAPTGPAHPRDRRAGRVHAFRYAAAVALASLAAVAVHVHHVNWAIVGAAVTLAAGDQRSRLLRGVHRVVGTMVGLGVTYLLLLPHMTTTALAVVVIVLLFPTELLMTRHYALALGFFTPMIMVMTDLAAPTRPSTLILERAEGTLLGVAAGAIIVLAVREPRPPVRVPPVVSGPPRAFEG